MSPLGSLSVLHHLHSKGVCTDVQRNLMFSLTFIALVLALSTTEKSLALCFLHLPLGVPCIDGIPLALLFSRLKCLIFPTVFSPCLYYGEWYFLQQLKNKFSLRGGKSLCSYFVLKYNFHFSNTAAHDVIQFFSFMYVLSHAY